MIDNSGTFPMIFGNIVMNFEELTTNKSNLHLKNYDDTN